MKQHLLAIVVLLGCLLTSCSNTDLADGPENPATRSSETGYMDLRDFGAVHNKMMDFSLAYTVKKGDSLRQKEFSDRVNEFHPVLKAEAPSLMNNSSVQVLAYGIKDQLELHKAYYGTNIDEHFLDPIANLHINGQYIKGDNILDQVYNTGILSDEDMRFLQKLSLIITDDTNPSLTANLYELQSLSDKWEPTHGYMISYYSTFNHTDTKIGFVSGICILVGIHSCEWWNSYIPHDENSPQRIAPLLGYLARRNIKGAIRGSLKYVLESLLSGKDITAKDLGTAALSDAVTSSIGGLLRFLK